MRELPEYKDSAEKSSVIHVITVNDPNDVNQHLDNLFNNPPKNIAFRGVNNASFKLFSTIQRRWYWDGLDDIYADVPSYIQHQINKARSNKCIMGNLSQDNDLDLDDDNLEMMSYDTWIPEYAVTDNAILDYILEEMTLDGDFLEPENVDVLVILNSIVSFHRSRRL